MKIDLHCHTKKAKSSEDKREVSFALFKEKITQAKVQIVAITNHNMFSEEQFDEFSSKMTEVLFLPGIELDVVGNKSGKTVQGHIIVIVDPKNKNQFVNIVNQKCTCSPDVFTISEDDFCMSFGQIKNSIIMCHYKKDKEITIEDFNYIKTKIDFTNVALLEPSNARKAGIIINSVNAGSWFGSDHHDWNNYPGTSGFEKLPDCLFNITEYNSLLSLLKNNQDAVLLNTFLNRKGPEEISIAPFSDLSLNLRLYKDVNVVFGGKATGKTEILKSIESKFIELGKKVSSFYAEEKKDELSKLLDYTPTDSELVSLKKNGCDEDFLIISKWTWMELPSLSKFYVAKQNEQTSAIIKKAKIVNAKFVDLLNDEKYKDEKEELKKVKVKIEEVSSLKMNDVLSETDEIQLKSLLNKLRIGKINAVISTYFDYISKYLEKYTIEFIGNKITNMQGTIKAPSSFGLTQLYNEQKKIDCALSNIRNRLDFSVILPKIRIGTLPGKGDVFRITRIGYKSQTKSEHKEFSRKMLFGSFKQADVVNFEKLLKNSFVCKTIEEYFSSIESLKQHIIANKISSLYDFVNYTNMYMTEKIADFKPSNGEGSILLVNMKINDNSSDVYILDEPDLGMGADYINSQLIPDIIYQSKQNKTIIISTHEPNMVVRTHPYCCVYREEVGSNLYETYTGSSFEENLQNVRDSTITKKFADTCIDKCEGGESAIKERERTYGHY
jgi:predicted ATPase